MSESEQSAEGATPEGAGSGTDPVAMTLALNAANTDPTIAEDARTYLREQRALAADQRQHLREQFKQLRMRHWELRLGVLLRFATAFTGLAFAAALALMIWGAAHAEGLVIESFSVPPDMAAKGITGQAVASQMLDRLISMQNVTVSTRPAKSYANNWGDDLKVEIPETGVSIGEVYRFLRGWLGHETRISGEVARTDKGIVVTARVSGYPGATFPGAEPELDTLILKAAEHVYSQTQPYRYARYLILYADQLGSQLRPDEAEKILQQLTGDPNVVEQGFAWNGLGIVNNTAKGNTKTALPYYRKAYAIDPDQLAAHGNAAVAEAALGWYEAALADYLQIKPQADRSSIPNFDPIQLIRYRNQVGYAMARLQGDFSDAVQLARKNIGSADTAAGINVAIFQAQLHEPAAAQSVYGDLPPTSTPADEGTRIIGGVQLAFALRNWSSVIVTETAVEKRYAQILPTRDFNVNIGLGPRIWLAFAKAKTGDISGAEKLISATPGDCYPCLITRAQIAAMQRQDARSDYWFALALKAAPSIPFAYTEWGKALMERGDFTGALAKFKLANQKGPHFADPLEMWGEVLVAQNRSDLALAKFTEAEKYAPNWGRLHLKWGEALLWTGKSAEAQKQFARAGELDLTAAEKAELTKVSGHG